MTGNLTNGHVSSSTTSILVSEIYAPLVWLTTKSPSKLSNCQMSPWIYRPGREFRGIPSGLGTIHNVTFYGNLNYANLK